MSEPLVVTQSLTIPASELSWSATRASGPGGQNVNKVSSKVELRFDLRGSRVLDELTRARLETLAGARVDGTGVLILVSQVTRDQRKNLSDARQKLAELVLRALERPKKRRPTKPSRGAKRARLSDKKKVAEKKRERRGREE
jgi:ribosome-associated protein